MDVQKVVYDSIDELNQQLSEDDRLIKSLDTKIFGSNSKLDSLGLVSLIVMVEQNIEDEFSVALTLADERAMSQKNSPFRTLGSLIDYIEILLKEKLDDW